MIDIISKLEYQILNDSSIEYKLISSGRLLFTLDLIINIISVKDNNIITIECEYYDNDLITYININSRNYTYIHSDYYLENQKTELVQYLYSLYNDDGNDITHIKTGRVSYYNYNNGVYDLSKGYITSILMDALNHNVYTFYKIEDDFTANEIRVKLISEDSIEIYSDILSIDIKTNFFGYIEFIKKNKIVITWK